MNSKNKKSDKIWSQYRRALITGGSSGLGKEFAYQLAALGIDLLLVARREKKLKELCDDLESKFGINTEYHTKDLSLDEDVDQLARYIADVGDIDILINNAGFGLKGLIADVDLNRALAMMKVHMWAPFKLIKAILPAMIDNGKGAIINVSSLGSFLPTRGSAMYASTKAFLRVLTESLAFEVESSNIRIQALCPGFTKTEFHASAEFKETASNIPGFLWMEPSDVIKISLKELEKGKKVLVLPGFKNKLFKFLLTHHILGKPLIRALQPKKI